MSGGARDHHGTGHVQKNRSSVTNAADATPQARSIAQARAILWASHLKQLAPRTGAEIGVWKGLFAEQIVAKVPTLEAYYLVDPWAHLASWDKPFNVADDEFAQVFAQAMNRTRDAPDRERGQKYRVLRGQSAEMAAPLPNGSLDFVYIDGDHTAEGTRKDLDAWYPKLRPGGWLCGDDYTDHQHDGDGYAPTRVKSVVDAFAKARHSDVKVLQLKQYYFRKD
jgi:hypothetical protein